MTQRINVSTTGWVDSMTRVLARIDKLTRAVTRAWGKPKRKRASKGMRKHIRRMKAEKRSGVRS